MALPRNHTINTHTKHALVGLKNSRHIRVIAPICKMPSFLFVMTPFYAGIKIAWASFIPSEHKSPSHTMMRPTSKPRTIPQSAA
jgi:hypothetical protein